MITINVDISGSALGSRPFEVELILSVKTYDIDFGGVVSNIVYVRWLEDLRTTILDTYCPLQQLLAQNQSPLVMRTQIDYRKAVRLFDQPIGRMWIHKLTRLKWFVTSEISVNGSLVATAEQMGCFVDLVQLQPIPIPALLSEQFQSFQI